MFCQTYLKYSLNHKEADIKEKFKIDHKTSRLKISEIPVRLRSYSLRIIINKSFVLYTFSEMIVYFWQNDRVVSKFKYR